MNVDVTGWAKRNIWRTNAGHLCVRPGLRRLTAPGEGRKWVAGFSVQNPWTLEFWHYIADVTSNNTDLVVRILDDNFVEWQSLQLGVDGVPLGFSYGVVQGEIMIGGIGMPTLWGFVGGPLILAEKVASDNPSTTAINVPQGIVAAVLNRIVIADGLNLFISDPVAVTGGSPRTFVAQNQNQRPGIIFGVHQGAGGQLVCVTAAGVWGLDPSAFAVQIVGSNGTDWRLLNHAEAASYQSSANVKGRIYGLTKRGMALIDVENDDEETLNDPAAPRRYGPRVVSLDWRQSRMYAGEEGPIVTGQDVVSMSDVTTGLRSWWDCGVASTFDVRGVLHDPDGADMLLCSDGVYAIGGNVDGDQLLSSEAATQPRGVLVGALPGDPNANQTVRRFIAAASNAGVGDIRVAVRGSSLTGLASGAAAEIPRVDAERQSMVIGTNAWGDGISGYQPVPLTRVRHDANYNTDEITVEVAIDIAETRIGPLVVMDLSASAPNRTPSRGAP